MAQDIAERTDRDGEADKKVSIAVSATGGDWDIVVGGQTADELAFNIAAEDLEAAIEELSSVPDGTVTVTGGPGNVGGTTPYVITFNDPDTPGWDPTVTTVTAELTGGTSTAPVTVVTAASVGTVSSVHQTTVITDPEDELAVQTEGGVGPKDQLAVHTQPSPAEAREDY